MSDDGGMGLVREAAACPFSWSLRRRRMFRACPRAGFLHYYGSRGGHDEHAEPTVRQLHLLKQLLPLELYFHELLAGELRALFHESPAPLPAAAAMPQLRRLVLRRFGLDRRDMLLGRFRVDHRVRVIAEFYDCAGSYRQFFDAAEAELKRRLEEPGLAAAAARLFAVPLLRRLRLPRPLPVQFNDLTIYGAPVLAWREPGKVNVLELGEVDEDDGLRLFIHRYYAATALKIPPERVCSFRIVPTDGDNWQPMPAEGLDFGACLDEILGDTEQLSGLIRPDGTVRENDFPAARAHCPRCRFREYCEGHVSSRTLQT